MKLKIAALTLVGLSLLGFGSVASAQAGCTDINFAPVITDQFPNAQARCWDVVTKSSGEQFAKFKVELVRTRNNSATFRFIGPDGSQGQTHSVDLDPSWRANIQGRDYRIRDLTRGQELTIYIPSDRWAAHVATDDASVAAATAAGATAILAEDTMDYGSSGSSLPATASAMPLFALLGGGALFAAFLVRTFRRR